MILFYLLPAAALLHIVEEFVFPGGFGTWYRNYKQDLSASFTAKYLVVINVILVLLCLLPLVLELATAVALWLTMASVVFFNALFHVRGTVRFGRYSPGVVTSVLVYIPLALYGYWYFLSMHLAPPEQGIASLASGLLYWWLSSLNHKRRSQKILSHTNRPA